MFSVEKGPHYVNRMALMKEMLRKSLTAGRPVLVLPE